MPALAVASVLLASVCLAQAADSLSGRWEGAVEIPGRQMTLVIDLTADASGHWTGSAIVPGFHVKGAPLSPLAVKDGAVEFTIAGVLGDPAVKARVAGDTLAGEFTASGNSAHFTLHRAGVAQVELPPTSTTVERALEGQWTAPITYMGNPFQVKLTLANKDGTASANFFLVRTKENPFPVDLVRQEDAQITLEMAGGQLGLDAAFDRTASEIRGTLRIGSVDVPIALRKGSAQ